MTRLTAKQFLILLGICEGAPPINPSPVSPSGLRAGGCAGTRAHIGLARGPTAGAGRGPVCSPALAYMWAFLSLLAGCMGGLCMAAYVGAGVRASVCLLLPVAYRMPYA